MDEQFRAAFDGEYGEGWLSWLGHPNLYDNALMVERDYDPKSPTMTAISFYPHQKIVVQGERKSHIKRDKTRINEV